MSRKEQTIGKHGQELAAVALRMIGIDMVEQIGTPIHLIPHPSQAGYYRVIFGEKVSGDHRGILPGGRSVLAETKTIRERPLRWSDFREHQPDRLDSHADAGGLSLVVWINEDGANIMRWPIPGFGPKKSIDLETARRLSIHNVSLVGG